MASASAIGGGSGSDAMSQLYQQQQKNTQDLVNTVSKGPENAPRKTLAEGDDSGSDDGSSSGADIADSALGGMQTG